MYRTYPTCHLPPLATHLSRRPFAEYIAIKLAAPLELLLLLFRQLNHEVSRYCIPIAHVTSIRSRLH